MKKIETYSNNTLVRNKNEFEDYIDDDDDADDDDDDDDDENDDDYNININSDDDEDEDDTSDENYSDVEKINSKKLKAKNSSALKSKRKKRSKSMMSDSSIDMNQINLSNVSLSRKKYSDIHGDDNNHDNILINKKVGAAETYLINRYKYAVRHIKQGLSVDEACNKYRISKGALLKCLSGGRAPRGKKTRLTENEENGIVEWLISNQNLKYNEAIHLVFEEVVNIFQKANRPNPFHNGKPSMDWWYDFLSRHPQIMASKPEWLRRGKVNDQYILDVQSGKLKCTKFRRALLSAIQYIRSLNDANNSSTVQATNNSHRSIENNGDDGVESQSIGSRVITSSSTTNKNKLKRIVNNNKKTKKKHQNDAVEKVDLKQIQKKSNSSLNIIKIKRLPNNINNTQLLKPYTRGGRELNTQANNSNCGAARINSIKKEENKSKNEGSCYIYVIYV